MSSGIIDIIKKVSLEAIRERATQVLFGKVTSVDPLVIKMGDTWELTEQFIVCNVPPEVDETVILMKYSNGNKYLVLNTSNKVVASSPEQGGIVSTEYSTEGQWKSLGTFTVTHYCCEEYHHRCNAGPPYTTATGTKPHVGGCAVDPKIIPLGSYVKLNGVVYHAEDTGGAIKGNRIDIVVEKHQEALDKGKYQAEVFLKVGD